MGIRFGSIPDQPRPPASGQDPYVGVQKSVRMSREELGEIFRAAKAQGMTAAGFIRQSAIEAARNHRPRG